MKIPKAARKVNDFCELFLGWESLKKLNILYIRRFYLAFKKI